MILQFLEGKKTLIAGLVVALAGFAQSRGWVHTGLSTEDSMELVGALMIVLRFATTGPQTVVKK